LSYYQNKMTQASPLNHTVTKHLAQPSRRDTTRRIQMGDIPRNADPVPLTQGPSLSSPRPPRLGSFYYRVARPFFGALLTIVLVVPVTAVAVLVAFAVAMDFGGPSKIFFAQMRMGRGGKPFTIWKFRTMGDSGKDHFGSWQEGEEEDRVTRLGKFLRRSHLDELPQLWNIICGDMAYIGPRPEMLEVHDWACKSVPGFDARLWIKPGITGLAQLGQGYVGNDVVAYEHKLEADLEYLSRLDFIQDLGILCRTPIWMLRLRGWHPEPAMVLEPVKALVPKIATRARRPALRKEITRTS